MTTVNRRLKFFKIYHHDKNSIAGEITEAINKVCEGPRQLLGYRAMHHKIRQVYGLNVTMDQLYATMIDVDPDELENRKPILKKKKAKGTFPSVGPNWVHSMDGDDKLLKYQNSTFPLAVYGCVDINFMSVWSKIVVYSGLDI